MSNPTNAPGRPNLVNQVYIFQAESGAWLIDIAELDQYGNLAWSAATSKGFDTYQEAFNWAARSLSFAEV